MNIIKLFSVFLNLLKRQFFHSNFLSLNGVKAVKQKYIFLKLFLLSFKLLINQNILTYTSF